jgi:hypothetical protein
LLKCCIIYVSYLTFGDEKAATIVNKIYEGDPASAIAFENLVHWKTGKLKN